jgi:hypothetical protein
MKGIALTRRSVENARNNLRKRMIELQTALLAVAGTIATELRNRHGIQATMNAPTLVP